MSGLKSPEARLKFRQQRYGSSITLALIAVQHGLNPEVYLTDVLARIQDHLTNRLESLLPWQWTPAKDLHEAV